MKIWVGDTKIKICVGNMEIRGGDTKICVGDMMITVGYMKKRNNLPPKREHCSVDTGGSFQRTLLEVHIV